MTRETGTDGADGRLSRRDFIRGASALTAAAALGSWSAPAARAQAAGSDALRIGVVGCGDRCRVDIDKFLSGVPEARVVAMGDLFKDKLDGTFAFLKEKHPGRFDVPAERQFVGFDAFEKVLASDIDVVCLITPTYFRPALFRAAVEARKHVFMEKPLAVDPVSLRHMMETAKMADAANLKVVVGTQMRRIAHLVEGMKRIHDGAIGDLLSGTLIRYSSALSNFEPSVRTPAMSDIEWQIRRFYFYTWAGGDFIVDQAIHNIDLINWVTGASPERCTGLGGRQSRTEEIYGNVFDHMSVEYTYPKDFRLEYHGSQIDNISHRNDQRIWGTKGVAYFDFATFRITGQNAWEYDGPGNDPMQAQFKELAAAIREDKPLNDAHRVAESTLTAMMGRMSAYTGRELQRDWVLNASKLKLGPEKLEFGPFEAEPVAQPGITPLV